MRNYLHSFNAPGVYLTLECSNRLNVPNSHQKTAFGYWNLSVRTVFYHVETIVRNQHKGNPRERYPLNGESIR